ncbi:hypothetical protein ACTXG7_05800 [Mycolicibacterium sp. Dal123E01]
MSNFQATRETVNVGRLTITSQGGHSAGQLCFKTARDEALCFARIR